MVSARQTLQQIVSEILGYDWELEMIEEPISGHTQFLVMKKFMIDRKTKISSNDLVKESCERIEKVLVETKWFQSELRKKDQEIPACREAMEKSQDEIERLKVFETHYEMEYTMRHGKGVDSVQTS